MNYKLFKNPFFWAVIIFIAAAFFRLLFLDLIEFKLDEAIWIYEITKFYLKPYLVTATFAPISIGFYYFPLAMYVFILFSALSRDPMLVSFIVALFNVLSIVFFYFVVRKFYGNIIAIFSSLFLSLSPWSILFSRKIWTPDLFLPFAIAFFYFIHMVLITRERPKQFHYLLLGFFGSLISQIHIPGLIIVLITFGIVLWQMARTGHDLSQHKKTLIGFFAGLIFVIPYLLRLLFKLGCQAGSCLKVQPVYQPFKSFDLFHFLRPFEYLTGLNFIEVLGKSYGDFLNTFPIIGFINILFIIELILPVIGIYYCLRVKKNTRFLAIYIFLFPLLYFIVKTPSYMYYYIVLSPIIAILTALGINYIYQSVKGELRYIVIGIFVLFILVTIVFESLLYNFLSTRQLIVGDYGPIFRLTKRIVEKETNQYISQNFYDEVKAYVYLYPSPQIMHGKLGEYLAQRGEPYFAIEEYKKQLQVDIRDAATQANLSYIYIVTGDYQKAGREIDILATYQATMAADLKRILKQAETAHPRGVQKQ